MFAVIVFSRLKSTSGGDAQLDDDFFGVFPTKERADEVADDENAKGKALVRRDKRLEKRAKFLPDYLLVSVTARVVELKSDGNGGFLAK